MKFDSHKTGVVVGILFAIMHSLWVILVAIGFGGLIVDGMKQIHFVQTNYQLTSFNVLTAVIGIALAFVIGYVIGWVFGWLWGKV